MADHRATNLRADTEVFAQGNLNVRDWPNLLGKPAGLMYSDQIATMTVAHRFDAGIDTTPGVALIERVGSTERRRVTTAGQHLFGTTNAAGMSAGDLMLPFEGTLRNAVGANDQVPLIRASLRQAIYGVNVAPSHPTAFGAAALLGAVSGEVVFEHGKNIRWTDSGGSAGFNVLRAGTNGIQHLVHLAPDGHAVTIGGTQAVGAGAGALVLGHGKELRGGNLAATNTIPIASVDSSNSVQLGGGTAIVKLANIAVPAYAAGLENGLAFNNGTAGRIYFYHAGARYYLQGTPG